MIKTWQQRCDEHPDHQQGIVTQQMIQDRMQEEIDELRQALSQPEEKMRIEGSGKLTTKPYPDGYESEQQFRQALANREWVGLTRRELDIATLGLEDLSDCYKAIEAKLKEKNT